ncbi:GNAT family N-acetyltransferase [Pinirhizobacter soli]|uniref:GNAT family N-acetyltransferase n=1 Tax=Pinirhizobacter soli TaxID=2786953 RepID=UPI003CE49989
MPEIMPVTLRDEHVALEPLAIDHIPGLEAAALDGELWNLWFTSVPPPGQMHAYVEKALAAQAEGRMQPFAIREATSGQIVGSTRFYDIEDTVPRMAIGYTWYAQSWQKTHLNTCCKRLLLQHAFETVGAASVQFHTDIYNVNSQRAIARLGATQEGILRSHQKRPNGTVRDTVCFSILATEWEGVKRSLDLRLERLTAPVQGAR